MWYLSKNWLIKAGRVIWTMKWNNLKLKAHMSQSRVDLSHYHWREIIIVIVWASAIWKFITFFISFNIISSERTKVFLFLIQCTAMTLVSIHLQVCTIFESLRISGIESLSTSNKALWIHPTCITLRGIVWKKKRLIFLVQIAERNEKNKVSRLETFDIDFTSSLFCPKENNKENVFRSEGVKWK